MARPKDKRRTLECEIMGASLGKTTCSLGVKLRRRSDFTPNDADELCRDSLLDCEFTIDPIARADADGQAKMLDTDEAVGLENASVHSVSLDSGGDVFGIRLSIHADDDAEQKLARLRYRKARVKVVRVGDAGKPEEPDDGDAQENLARDGEESPDEE